MRVFSVGSLACFIFLAYGCSENAKNKSSAHASVSDSCTDYIDAVPANLDQAGATYCLKSDIAEDGDVSFKSGNVTLNGQGYSFGGKGSFNSIARFDNVTITNVNAPNYGVNFVYQDGAEGIRITDSKLGGLFLSGVTGLVLKNNDIHGGLGLTGKAGPCTVPGDSSTEADCGTGVVQNVDIWSEDDEIDGNTFHDENLENARYVQLSFLQRLTFRNNTLSLKNSSGNLLQVHYTVDSLFEGNTIDYDFNLDQSAAYDEGNTVNIRDDTSRCTFRGNVVRSNGGTLMLLGGPGNERWLEGVNDENDDSEGDGSFFGFDNTVENNTFILSYSPMNSFGVRHMTTHGGDRFMNNLIYVEGDPSSTIWAVLDDASQSDPASPTVWSHNTIVNAHGEGNVFEIDGPVTMRNNILYGGRADESISGKTKISDGSDHNLFFPAEDDVLASQSHSLSGDPKFSDVNDLDFHLQSGSVALSAGDDGKDLGIDFTALESGSIDKKSSGGCAAHSSSLWVCFLLTFLVGIRLRWNLREIVSYSAKNADESRDPHP